MKFREQGMKCRKCKEYGWNDPQEALEGKDVCVFHAPKDEKGMDGKVFRSRVHSRIREFKENATSQNVCKFDGTIFSENISFKQYNRDNPLPKIRFNKAVFWGKADFFSTKFGGEACFFNVEFGPITDFTSAEFDNFAEFAHSTFNGRCCFGGTKFGEVTSFKGVTFVEGLQIAVESGDKVNFEDTIFKEQTLFDKVFYKSASFRSVTAEKGLVFRNIKPLNAWFPYTKMDNIRFGDCEWKTENDKKGGRIHVSLEDENLTQAEDFYRRMKQKYKNENHESEASRWHLAEKEVYRKRLRGDKRSSRFLRFALGLYRWSSGYGEDPWRAFKWLLIFLMLPFLYFCIAKILLTGFSFLPNWEAWRNIFQSVYSFFPLTKVDQRVLEGNVFEVAIRPFWKLLVAAQAALLVFALRNKFRR